MLLSNVPYIKRGSRYSWNMEFKQKAVIFPRDISEHNHATSQE